MCHRFYRLEAHSLTCSVRRRLLACKVTMKSIVEHDLNVQYDETFYEREVADSMFEELFGLDYKDIQFNIGFKSYTPLRKVCAFADNGLSYMFSGTTVVGEPWTPLLLKLKEDVEAKVGCQFNFVLVNLYADGFAKIGAHMDNEEDLDPEAPIAALSFGAKRKLIFQRKGFQSVTLPVDHGSLYLMNSPTNKFWKHSIPAEPDVREPRISLTFRRMDRPAAGTKRPADALFFPPEKKKVCLQDPVFKKDLGNNVYFSAELYQEEVKVHIREHGLSVDGKLFPTKKGVVMDLNTWYDFISKISNFNLCYTNASFVAHNNVLVLNVNSNLLMQNLYTNEGIHTKASWIEINSLMLCNLRDFIPEANQKILNYLYCDYLKILINNERRLVCNLITEDEAQLFTDFILCLENKLCQLFSSYYECHGCVIDHPSQRRHDCLMLQNCEK